MLRKTFILLMLAAVHGVSTAAPALDSITAADRRGDIAALEAMRAGIEAAESFDEAYANAYLEYRLASQYLGAAREDAAAAAAQASAEAANEALEHDADSAEALALLSAGLGMQISVSPMKGMMLGPRADGAIKRALELAPDNLRVHLIKGIALLNKPALFGGSSEKAIAEFTRAIELARQQAGNAGWGATDAFIWRGIARRKAGESDAAEDFESAIAIAPDHAWAQHLLKQPAAEAAADD